MATRSWGRSRCSPVARSSRRRSWCASPTSATGGRGFVARYEREGQVVLELGEGERSLPEVAAIDGTRYDDGTYELRLHRRTATLKGPASTYSNCVVRDWQEAEPG